MNASIEAHRHNRLLTWFTFWVLVVYTLSILASAALNHSLLPLASLEGRRFPLEISPDRIDLGIVYQGESAQSSLLLRNTRIYPPTLERIDTICARIQIMTTFPVLIGTDETRALAVTFDSSSEPMFLGSWAVNVMGYCKAGLCVLETHVDLKVRTKSEDAQRMPKTLG